jgi:hypothetical protein
MVYLPDIPDPHQQRRRRLPEANHLDETPVRLARRIILRLSEARFDLSYVGALVEPSPVDHPLEQAILEHAISELDAAIDELRRLMPSVPTIRRSHRHLADAADFARWEEPVGTLDHPDIGPSGIRDPHG